MLAAQVVFIVLAMHEAASPAETYPSLERARRVFGLAIYPTNVSVWANRILEIEWILGKMVGGKIRTSLNAWKERNVWATDGCPARAIHSASDTPR